MRLEDVAVSCGRLARNDLLPRIVALFEHSSVP